MSAILIAAVLALFAHPLLLGHANQGFPLLTHAFHQYPAGMQPATASHLLKTVLPGKSVLGKISIYRVLCSQVCCLLYYAFRIFSSRMRNTPTHVFYKELGLYQSAFVERMQTVSDGFTTLRSTIGGISVIALVERAPFLWCFTFYFAVPCSEISTATLRF